MQAIIGIRNKTTGEKTYVTGVTASGFVQLGNMDRARVFDTSHAEYASVRDQVIRFVTPPLGEEADRGWFLEEGEL